MSARLITSGFLAAGLVNIVGVLVFSMGFTNSALSEAYPEVFSRFGLIVIMVWGAAYLSVARSYRSVPWLVAVFALEKLVYVGSWIYWLVRDTREPSLAGVFGRSPITGVFYAIYGGLDLTFGVFFLAVAWQCMGPDTVMLTSNPAPCSSDPDPGP